MLKGQYNNPAAPCAYSKAALCRETIPPRLLCCAKSRVFMFLDSERLFVKTFRLSRALCLLRKGV